MASVHVWQLIKRTSREARESTPDSKFRIDQMRNNEFVQFVRAEDMQNGLNQIALLRMTAWSDLHRDNFCSIKKISRLETYISSDIAPLPYDPNWSWRAIGTDMEASFEHFVAPKRGPKK